MRVRIFVLPRYLLFLLTLVFGGYAQAVVINFDDIERVHPNPDDEFWADQPLTDEYLAKGLLIDDGYLGSYYEDDPYKVSGKNFLQGGPYFNLTFVGELPTWVSLIVTSSHEDVVYLDAFCGDGSSLYQKTPGWAGPYDETPFQALNKIEFYSAAGISHINISAFYFLRTSAQVDDLSYEYSLPEPNVVLLFAIGLLLLLWQRAGRIRR